MSETYGFDMARLLLNAHVIHVGESTSHANQRSSQDSVNCVSTTAFQEIISDGVMTAAGANAAL